MNFDVKHHQDLWFVYEAISRHFILYPDMSKSVLFKPDITIPHLMFDIL